MENLIVALLPRRPQHPALVRYGATLIIVGAAFVLRLAMKDQLGAYPMLLFIPAIFLSALLYGQASGIFATFVSALLAAYFFMLPQYSLAIGLVGLVPLLIYIAIGCLMASVTGALRRTAQKLHTAEKRQSLLLEEMSHRTKNNLMMVTSMLTLQARALDEPAARTALEVAVARVGVIAKAHDRLHAADQTDEVDLATYLGDLCHGLGELLRDIRPIAVRVQAQQVRLGASAAVPIGLIVNELVTNAFKYAFPKDRGGTVTVSLHSEHERLRLIVADDGVGCPPAETAGLGSRLVRLLAAQLGGEVTRPPVARGCCVVVELPTPVSNG